MTSFPVYDVTIIGGGPAGIGAALASARMGRRTLLVEKQEQLGGMGTNALVNNFCNAHYDQERHIIGGIFAEIREALIRRDALFVTYSLEPFNHVVYLEIIRELCAKAGVEVMTCAALESAVFPPNAPAQLTVAGRTIQSRTVVDASGDAVAAQLAGASFHERPRGGKPPMPLTYCYIFGPIDLKTVSEKLPNATQMDHASGEPFLSLGGQPELVEAVRQARKNGELSIPRKRIAVAYAVPGSRDHISVNFGRVMIEDPTDPEQLRRAEEVGLAQVKEGEAFFRKYVPGCENGRVVELARQIGIRESRQIRGLHCLTKDDVLSYRQFDDVIAQCCYSIDIHEPNSDATTMIGIPAGQHYDIPYRCLVPADGPGNLIVAGRCISATQEAMSSFRVSPSVMAIGEAAGTAAAMVSETKVAFANLSVPDLQANLLRHGGILS